MPRPALIRKQAIDLAVAPNLADYAAECRAFTWDAARHALDGLPGGCLNIAHEAVDRHARGARASHIAFRFLGAQSQRELSYAELARLTNRFANVLKDLGVGRGERVFVLTGRIPALYTAVLGSFKAGCVVSPLFSAFGPGAAGDPPEAGRGGGTGHDRQPVRTQGGENPRPVAGAAPCAAGGRRRPADRPPRHTCLGPLDGAGVRRLRHRGHAA